jgi:hypothetical protein
MVDRKVVPFDEFYYQLKLMHLFQKYPVYFLNVQFGFKSILFGIYNLCIRKTWNDFLTELNRLFKMYILHTSVLRTLYNTNSNQI